MGQISNGPVIVGSKRFVFGVADEHQRQIVGISSADEFRCAIGKLTTRGKKIMTSQNRFDPTHLADRSDVERNRPETQRLLASVSVNAPRFTEDQDNGSGRHI